FFRLETYQNWLNLVFGALRIIGLGALWRADTSKNLQYLYIGLGLGLLIYGNFRLLSTRWRIPLRYDHLPKFRVSVQSMGRISLLYFITAVSVILTLYIAIRFFG